VQVDVNGEVLSPLLWAIRDGMRDIASFIIEVTDSCPDSVVVISGKLRAVMLTQRERDGKRA
jgi:hypothetical protein